VIPDIDQVVERLAERRDGLLDLANTLRRWAGAARDQYSALNDVELAAKLETLADECTQNAKALTLSTPQKREASARLTAAAPELFNALRDAVAALGGIHSDNVPESVRAAIASVSQP
jgi:uncharacterized protein YceH (UPF0502 family)